MRFVRNVPYSDCLNRNSDYAPVSQSGWGVRSTAMIFRQLFDSVSGTYSYLIASRRGGEAMIIDPVLEKVDRYLQLIGELDLKLVKAVDTHLHADHITGLGALRDRTHCITVMGDQSKVDVVSMRVADGDQLGIEGVNLDVLYTPGHTDDSYSFLMSDRVFTGDTLLIRGTGRTDFQNGDPRAQYESIFGRLLKLPDETLVFPAHDYKGDTVSTIGEEKAFNPRLQVKSVDEYVDLMNSLNLPNPKMMDVAVPANMRVGLAQEEIARRGWAVTARDAIGLLGGNDLVFIDLREPREREKHGVIPGSLNAPYPDLPAHVRPGGMLHELVAVTHKRPLFFCAYGERSAMAVQAAQDAGLQAAFHIQGGLDAWKKAGGPVERLAPAPIRT
jgi:glyoxylase-like metal-dependent hydrolase (beta-lactamase superfamily II)/rhodanese-related sulfurtransferase